MQFPFPFRSTPWTSQDTTPIHTHANNTNQTRAPSAKKEETKKDFAANTTPFSPSSTAFISTLIYASVIYHRHRISARLARSRSALNHERYDPFYNGPFSDPRILEADYSRVVDDYPAPLHHEPRPTNDDRVDAPPAYVDEPLESGGHEVALPRLDGWRRELEGEREAYELAANRSVRSFGPLG